MNIEIIRDTVSRQNYSIQKGSVIQNVREFKRSYRGIYCSMFGSYFVTIPKTDCKIICK